MHGNRGMSKKDELLLRNEVIMETVELLNQFGEFLAAPSNSPQEDQLEAALDERMTRLMAEGTAGLGGHICLALVALVHECSDPDRVQEWLDDAGKSLIAEAEQFRDGD